MKHLKNKLILLLPLLLTQLSMAAPTDLGTGGIDLGTGFFADHLLEPLVSIMLQTSDKAMKVFIIIAAVFIVLDIIMSGLNALITEKYTNTVTVIVSKIITYTMLIWLMNNWFSGKQIFVNYIFKPIFIYVPEYFVGSQINLDYIWNTLMDLVSIVFNSALGGLGIWTLLFGNIGVVLVLIFLSFIMFVQVALLYVKIVIAMLQMYMIANFSFLAIIFNFNEYLARKWGGVMIKSYLVLMVQYTMLFILIHIIRIGADTIVSSTSGMGGFLMNLFTGPIGIFIMAGLIYMLVKLADKCVDIIINVSNKM